MRYRSGVLSPVLESDIKKYAYIDALRGMAILGVILVHSSHSVEPAHETLLWVMREGARGVQLFFVASAITLCMSWMTRSPYEKFPIRNFYIRRFFRIAPMFYIAILTYSILNGFSPSYWAPNGISWWFVPVTAAFLHGFHPETITSVVPGGWSIAVEMNFYFILPFLLPRIQSIQSCFFFLVIGIGLSGLNLLLVPQIFAYPESRQYLLKNFCYFNFFGQLPIFVMGICCYFILRENYPRRQITMVSASLLAVFLPAFLYPAFNLPDYFFAGKLFKLSHHFIAGGLFSVCALLLAYHPIRLLVNRITITFGKLSFSMYLSHFAVLTLFSATGFSQIFPVSDTASLLHFLCVVLVTAGVSSFFYRYIEKPGMALGKMKIDNKMS